MSCCYILSKSGSGNTCLMLILVLIAKIQCLLLFFCFRDLGVLIYVFLLHSVLNVCLLSYMNGLQTENHVNMHNQFKLYGLWLFSSYY